MRIGIDARGLRASLDGIGRYTRNLIRGLCRADADSEYVLFMLPDVDDAFLPRRERITIVRYPHRHLTPATVFRFGDAVRGARLDLLHIPFFVGPWRYPVPTVVTVHDLMALTYPRFFTGRNLAGELAARAFHRMVVPSSVRRADLVFADSEWTRVEIIRVLRVAPERIEVVHPFADDCFRSPLTEDAVRSAQEKLGIAGPYVLFLGNTKPYKNLPGLLAGYADLVRRQPEPIPSLVLVGPPDRFRAQVESAAVAHGIRQSVFLGGEVPDEILVPVMKGAMALCFPSLEEGFGLPVLEAMTVGTPVVTSRTSSLPEVAGDAALLVDPCEPSAIGEALCRIATDTDLRSRLVALGKRQAERFDPSRIVAGVLAAYRRVAEGSK